MLPMVVSALIKRVRSQRRLPEPRLRRLVRESVGVSLEDVASELGVTRSAVSRWETGLREPRGTMVARYADLLERLAAER